MEVPAGGGGVAPIFFKKVFIWVILKLHTEFQPSAIPGTGQKNFPGRVGGWEPQPHIWEPQPHIGWVAGLIENKANSLQSAIFLLNV